VKKIASIITVGFGVIGTAGICTFVGIKLGYTVVGIITGFILAMAYLLYNVVKK